MCTLVHLFIYNCNIVKVKLDLYTYKVNIKLDLYIIHQFNKMLLMYVISYNNVS